VVRKDYRQALEIMEKQLKIDETTAFYGDFIKRLRDINDIQESFVP